MSLVQVVAVALAAHGTLWAAAAVAAMERLARAVGAPCPVAANDPRALRARRRRRRRAARTEGV